MGVGFELIIPGPPHTTPTQLVLWLPPWPKESSIVKGAEGDGGIVTTEAEGVGQGQ